jgi:hypothetical protein
MKGLNAINNAVNEISNDLTTDGHHDIAKILNQYSAQLHIENEREKALNEIIGLCNIRSMGDLNMPSYNGWQWANKIEKLGKKCSKLIYQLHQNT